jgi:hypothetical protein
MPVIKTAANATASISTKTKDYYSPQKRRKLSLGKEKRAKKAN